MACIHLQYPFVRLCMRNANCSCLPARQVRICSWNLQEQPASVPLIDLSATEQIGRARGTSYGSLSEASPRQHEWPRVSKLSARNQQQVVLTLELKPESQDRGLRQQVGRRRRAQARAAAYARWHHGPAPTPPRPIPAALPMPRPSTLDGTLPCSSCSKHICSRPDPLLDMHLIHQDRSMDRKPEQAAIGCILGHLADGPAQPQHNHSVPFWVTFWSGREVYVLIHLCVWG